MVLKIKMRWFTIPVGAFISAAIRVHTQLNLPAEILSA